MKKMLLFFGMVSHFCLGCSFSKNEPPTVKPLAPHASSDSLSNIQKNILASIQTNNLTRLKLELGLAKPKDLVFPQDSSTPMGLALKLNHKDLIETLIAFNVDPSNLGNEQQNFNLIAFSIQTKKMSSLLNTAETTEFKMAEANPTQEFLFRRNMEAISGLVSQILDNKTTMAEAEFFKSRFNCTFLEINIILQYMQNSNKAFNKIEEFLNNVGCKPSMNPEMTQTIYQIELTRQFQNFFFDGTLLSYISRHPHLTNKMWNIDKSGFWISPNLLFRIAFSDENIYLTKKERTEFCEGNFNTDFEGCYINQELKTYTFFEKNKIALPEYELIHTKNGSIFTSYRYFNREVVNSQDDFYEKVSHFLHGKKVYYEIEDPNDKGSYIPGSKEKPWQIGFQEMEDDVVD